MEISFILFHDYLNVSFARSEDGKRRANCVAPYYPYYLVPLIFHFWSCVKDKLCSHSINMLV
jgi:hypothetical protein